MPTASSTFSVSPPTSRFPRWTSAVAALLFLTVAVSCAYYIVFSRSMSPDEGYLMITVQSFIEGNALYDTVFTHYGPFYYAYEWVVHALLSIPLTHDATRLLCIFHWLTAAVVFGFAGGVITRSALAGMFVFMQATIHLTTLATEPGHPQELVVMLLATGMLIAARPPRRVGAYGSLAVVAALLLFTKINVGIFFGMALLLTLRCGASDRFARGAWLWLLTAGCAALPALLMRTHLAAEWCRNYSLIAASTILTTLLMANKSKGAVHPGPCVMSGANPKSETNPNHGSEEIQKDEGTAAAPCYPSGSLFTMSAAFLASSSVVLGIALLTGTSVKGLMDGLFLTPLKMPGVALLPLPLSNTALLNAILALVVGIVVAAQGRSPRLAQFINVLKLVFGLAGAFCLLGDAKAQLAYLVPWIWLVLAPSGGETVETVSAFPAVPSTPLKWGVNEKAGFAPVQFGQSSMLDGASGALPRVFLCLAATWQSLQAYPIAGTQVTSATILVVLAYTICLYDVFQLLTRRCGEAGLQSSDSHSGNPEGRPVRAPGLHAQEERPPAGRVPSPGTSVFSRNENPLFQPRTVLLVPALTAIGLLYLFGNVCWKLADARHEYASLPPLGLPGSRLVHMDSETTEMYRALSQYLQTECDTFVTYPGINSLYFWTGKRPPTHLNSTGWGPLSHEQQEQILAALRTSRRPMLVVVAAAAQNWPRYVPPQISPLVHCALEDYREETRIGRFIILVPRSPIDSAQAH